MTTCSCSPVSRTGTATRWATARAITHVRRLLHRRSILDLVTDRTSRLMGDLGPSDRRKLDEYLSSVREIEVWIERAEKDPTGLTPGIDKPTGVPVLYADYVTLMCDLQIVAFQTDSTRVITMMMGREGSMRTYTEVGIPDPHHLRTTAAMPNGSRR